MICLPLRVLGPGRLCERHDDAADQTLLAPVQLGPSVVLVLDDLAQHGVRRRGQIHDVILGASPFVVTLLAMVTLICVYPQLVLWLPEAMR